MITSPKDQATDSAEKTSVKKISELSKEEIMKMLNTLDHIDRMDQDEINLQSALCYELRVRSLSNSVDKGE